VKAAPAFRTAACTLSRLYWTAVFGKPTTVIPGIPWV